MTCFSRDVLVGGAFHGADDGLVIRFDVEYDSFDHVTEVPHRQVDR